MRLYLRRDNSMVHSRFVVCDENGNEKYIVTGKHTDAIGKMAISSTDGEVLVKIRMMLSTVLSTFVISDGSERFTMLVKASSASPQLRIHGIDWIIKYTADFNTLEVYDTDGTLVMVRKAETYISKGYYTLEVFSIGRELFSVAVAVCAGILNFSDSIVPATT